uniref:Uncharacterized protein n=1 Tax=Triticum urartu TaxID=4572 RepID=A0A8R7UB61_TRIUA
SPENHQFSLSHHSLNSHPPFCPHPPNFSAVPAPAGRRMPRQSKRCCRHICPSSAASAYAFARRCPRRIYLAPKKLIFGSKLADLAAALDLVAAKAAGREEQVLHGRQRVH